MATILRTNGKREEYTCKDNHITIAEISTIVNGLVEPLFIGEFWFFLCKNALRLKRDLNNQASEILGMEVWGDAIIAKDTELSPTFFFPEQVIKEIKVMSAQMAKKIIKDNPEISESKVTDEEKIEATNHLMHEGYKNLIESGKSFQLLMKNFEIYNDGVNVINVPPVLEARIDATNILIDYFTKNEEYDKCAKLIELKNKIIDFYKDF